MNIENATSEELSSQIINTPNSDVPSLTEFDTSLSALRQQLKELLGL